MKQPARMTLACLLLCLAHAGTPAQTGAATESVVTQQQRQQRREHIAQQRERQQALFRAAEEACYQRFAVNDCLHAARVQRRAALDELRRQEVILNDLDRQEQAQATLERIGHKLGVEAEKQPSAPP